MSGRAVSSGPAPRVPRIGKDLFKRSIFGYRRREVERELALRDERVAGGESALREVRAQLDGRLADLKARDERVGLLDGVTRYLARLVVARDRELQRLREEMAELRSREERGALAARGGGEEDTLKRLEREVAEIGAQARGQATRIRMQALRQAAQLAASPGGERQDKPGTGSGAGGANGGRAGVDVFEGLVHMEVGPLHDFSQLVRFEDAVTGIGGASEISVKRFSKGRATLAVRLERPIELLRELEEQSPFEIEVRSLKDDRLIVDVNEA